MNTKIRISIWIVALFLVFSGIGLSSRKAFAASGIANLGTAGIIDDRGSAIAEFLASLPSTGVDLSNFSGQVQSPDITTGDEPYLSSLSTFFGQIQSPDITTGDEPYLSPWPTTSGQTQSLDITAGDEPYLSPWPTTSGQIQSPDSTPGDKPYLSP